MPRWKENTTSGWSSTDAKISDLFSIIIANGSTLIARCTPHYRWRSKFYAVFINGVWKGNYRCPYAGKWEMIFPLDVGTIASSFYVVEAGQWDDYETQGAIPSGWIEEHEIDFAKRLRISWNASYITEGPTGDSQLASVVVTGADRGDNCESVTDYPTRAILTYSINSIGTTHTVRIWQSNTLVAEGAIVGDGLVTCNAIGGSGLTVQGILTYANDINAGQAKISLRWPQSYEISYDTSVLSFPRTPEFILYDDGTSNAFQYLTPVLAGPSYYYNVLTRSDENVLQTTIVAPSDSPKNVNQRPIGPTITSVTGTAANTVVHWTEGESGCSYNVFYSSPDQPINVDTWVSPVQFSVPVGSISATLPTITGWAAVDRSSWITALGTSIDAAVAILNSAWTVGETGFDAALTAFETSVIAAIEVYEELLDYNLSDPKEDIWDNTELLRQFCRELIGNGLTVADWQIGTHEAYARLLSTVGVIYDNLPTKWLAPDGIPAVVMASLIQTPLCDVARPTLHRPMFCVIVRATRQSDNLQEAMDGQFCWTYDDSGNVQYPPPNDAYINDIAINGLSLTLTGIYYDSDEQGVADYLDFYCVPAASSINYGSTVASKALSESIAGKKLAEVTFSTTAGYKRISVKARVAFTGRRSDNSIETTIYVSGAAPAGVTGLHAEIIRGEEATA